MFINTSYRWVYYYQPLEDSMMDELVDRIGYAKIKVKNDFGSSADESRRIVKSLRIEKLYINNDEYKRIYKINCFFFFFIWL